MKRAATLCLLFCILLVWAAPIAQADDPLVITPYYGGPDFYATAGQEVIIRAGWSACTRGLTEAFRHAASVSMEVSFNGTPVLDVEPPSRDHWTQPEPAGTDTTACVMQTNHYWSTEWLYSLGAVEAGLYELHFVYTITHPLPDGGDYDGDGRPDLVTPDNFRVERYITITVT